MSVKTSIGLFAVSAVLFDVAAEKSVIVCVVVALFSEAP